MYIFISNYTCNRHNFDASLSDKPMKIEINVLEVDFMIIVINGRLLSVLATLVWVAARRCSSY